MHICFAFIAVFLLGISNLNAQSQDSHGKVEILPHGDDSMESEGDSAYGGSLPSSATDEDETDFPDQTLKETASIDSMESEEDSAYGGSLPSSPIDEDETDFPDQTLKETASIDSMESEEDSAYGGSLPSTPIDEDDSSLENLKIFSPIDHPSHENFSDTLGPQETEEEGIFYDAEDDLFFDAEESLKTEPEVSEVHTGVHEPNETRECSRSVIRDAKAYFKNKMSHMHANAEKFLGAELKEFLKSVAQLGCGVKNYSQMAIFESAWEASSIQMALNNHVDQVVNATMNEKNPLGSAGPESSQCSLKAKAQLISSIGKELDKAGITEKSMKKTRDKFTQDVVRGVMYDGLIPICENHGFSKSLFKAFWKGFNLDKVALKLSQDPNNISEVIADDAGEGSCPNLFQKTKEYVTEMIKSSSTEAWKNLQSPEVRKNVVFYITREIIRSYAKEYCRAYSPMLSDHFYKHAFKRYWKLLEMDWFLRKITNRAYNGASRMGEQLYNGATYAAKGIAHVAKKAAYLANVGENPEEDTDDEPYEGDMADLGLSSF